MYRVLPKGANGREGLYKEGMSSIAKFFQKNYEKIFLTGS
jgi:hypothetical protein